MSILARSSLSSIKGVEDIGEIEEVKAKLSVDEAADSFSCQGAGSLDQGCCSCSPLHPAVQQPFLSGVHWWPISSKASDIAGQGVLSKDTLSPLISIEAPTNDLAVFNLQAVGIDETVGSVSSHLLEDIDCGFTNEVFTPGGHQTTGLLLITLEGPLGCNLHPSLQQGLPHLEEGLAQGGCSPCPPPGL
jgi:hypothetical protein